MFDNFSYHERVKQALIQMNIAITVIVELLDMAGIFDGITPAEIDKIYAKATHEVEQGVAKARDEEIENMSDGDRLLYDILRKVEE